MKNYILTFTLDLSTEIDAETANQALEKATKLLQQNLGTLKEWHNDNDPYVDVLIQSDDNSDGQFCKFGDLPDD